MDWQSERAEDGLADTTSPDSELDKLKKVMTLSRIADHLEAAKAEVVSLNEPTLRYMINMVIYETGVHFAKTMAGDTDQSRGSQTVV